MELFFEEEGEESLSLDYETIARNVIEETLDYIDCPYEVELNLLLTDNNGIRELNSRFRNIDKATDVLSFPMISFETIGDFEWLEKEEEHFDPETGALLLGDIVISKEKILSQAKEFGHTIKREYAFLIAHSMLHLFGYDHMDEEERKQMEEEQRVLLNRLGILR